MILPIKTIMSVLKISTYIIPNITALPIRLAAILAMISVSTFMMAVILYIFLFFIELQTTCYLIDWSLVKEERYSICRHIYYYRW